MNLTSLICVSNMFISLFERSSLRVNRIAIAFILLLYFQVHVFSEYSCFDSTKRIEKLLLSLLHMLMHTRRFII